ncbi:hypothetical protein MTR67_044415 [Solanum verrucosum]|uniref:DUF4216 domain-containing protein n=1 Tax=Solanum verrucosum TaxID=315347 RepID=A0AAF0US64_SOLVR|nr:hypothetical protein MTR67_044415 [Solanum verrucosum]
MDVKGKTKDNPKARTDIKEYCRRRELWLQELQNGKIVKPKASFSFALDEKREICEWVKILRMPEGYALNLGMKSHDCHVFMETLIPIDFRHLPERIWKPITEISLFFKDLCSGKFLESSLDRMEENIPVITTKLEKIFSCGFFEVMEHLPIHLVQEARLGSPVQTRWMYSFERKIGSSKQTIKQRGKIEGSVVQGHIGRETGDFYSYYFGIDVSCRRNRPNRNDEGIRKKNSGVFIQGDVDGTGQTIEYYGVIYEIIGVRYSGWPKKKIVLFSCKWFDPSHRGTKEDQQHNIIEAKHTRKYISYDPFIIAQNAKQVHYAPYPLRRDKVDCWVVINTKHVGRIEIDNVLDVAYQNEVAIVHQQADVELETTLEHPQHILEKVFDDEIMINVEEEINEDGENDLFDNEEYDNENQTTEEEEWESDGNETSEDE